MRPLTARQKQILELIKDNILQTGMPPTRAEIARILGFKSPNAAEEHLKALAKKGMIEIIAGTSRGIRLIDQGEDEAANEAEGLPLIGRVAAGSPILAEQHVESHYQVDPMLFKPGADFLLRVYGDSMINVGILDGDLLAVHRTQSVQNGQVVVARVGDEVTVKRYQQKGAKVLLLAENDDFDPIEVDLTQNEFAIEGLAVGVVRNSGGF
ncbi:transcriptional repressor LexA [Gayadomonas joobiniege]|uniref:transcriptional repressor LexA n=1 Tax=Gayadomonas joobiniege TaxID=1234606 RepID=UPI000474B471|nr:transcriptional repressor LexA [Gayadomonas joobiniege]